MWNYYHIKIITINLSLLLVNFMLMDTGLDATDNNKDLKNEWVIDEIGFTIYRVL